MIQRLAYLKYMAFMSILAMGYGALFDHRYIAYGEWYTVLYYLNYFIFLGINNPYYTSIHEPGKLITLQ